jgi:hypothetical protein
MPDTEKILDVLHVGEFPVYEVVELCRGGEIKIRYVMNPEESITLDRCVIPLLVRILEKIKI